MKPCLYIAHEYGRRHLLSEGECLANVQKSVEIERECIIRGWNTFNPLHHHWVHAGWEETLPEEEYFELVSHWIRYCDAFLQGSTIRWEASGVQRELNLAMQLNLDIYYSLNEVPFRR